MSDKLDWIEKQAAENLKFRLQICETLAKDANNLLTVLIAAIGAVVAYAINSVSDDNLNMLSIGAIAMTAWLMLVATGLVVKCIVTTDLMPPGNEPKNLSLNGYSLEQIRKFELDNVQNSINHVAIRNQNTVYWLDKARLAAVASPIVFILAAAVFWIHQNVPCAQVA
jgi:hypothetical protein